MGYGSVGAWPGDHGDLLCHVPFHYHLWPLHPCYQEGNKVPEQRHLHRLVRLSAHFLASDCDASCWRLGLQCTRSSCRIDQCQWLSSQYNSTHADRHHVYGANGNLVSCLRHNWGTDWSQSCPSRQRVLPPDEHNYSSIARHCPSIILLCTKTDSESLYGRSWCGRTCRLMCIHHHFGFHSRYYSRVHAGCH